MQKSTVKKRSPANPLLRKPEATKYAVLNDSSSAPLRFISPRGTTVGQFYNSVDGLYHLAEYVPYAQPPCKYLCGKHGNYSPSREERNDRPICEKCFAQLHSDTHD